MFSSLWRFLVIPLIGFGSVGAFAQCNGHAELCGKRYNEVAYLTTHNAFNAGDDGFNLPNQTHGLTQQLNEGVRALMLDVYDEGGIATVYHGFTWLGTTTLESNFNEIKAFLDANPNEVVTFLFETYISANLMDTVLTQTGLKPLLHVQELGEPWPTLQEMIDSGKRLVFFSDHNNAQPGQDWYHYMWSFVVETNWENHALSDFSCDFNRGSANNDLFILNHFATDANLGTGRTDFAAQANSFNYFQSRAVQCWEENDKFPNFPTVDFYELGNTLEVVDSLNGIPSSVGIDDVSEHVFSVSPNPSRGLFRIDLAGKRLSYSVFNVKGKCVLQGDLIRSSTIDLTDQPQGIYFLSITYSKGTEIIKLINLPN